VLLILKGSLEEGEYMKVKNARYYVLFYVLIVTQFFFTANAATITVNSRLDDDGNGCTLREAIASVNNPSSLAVQNNGCTLGDGNNDTINFAFFSAIGTPPVITLFLSGFLTISADDVTLNGFTIQNVRGDSSFGTAISASGANNVRVLNCRFTSNTTNLAPLSISRSSNVLISNSEFTSGFGGGSIIGAGAVRISDSDGVIENSIFVSNFSETNGGAINLANSTDFEIRQSLFVGNQAASDGGAIVVSDDDLPFRPGDPAALIRTKIVNNTFTGNAITSSSNIFNNGNVLSLEIRTNGIEIINNTIVSNGDSDNSASAIAISTTDDAIFSIALYNNIVSGNMAIDGIPAAFGFTFGNFDLSTIQSSGNIIGDASRSSDDEVNVNIPGDNIFVSSDRDNIPLSQIVGRLSENGGPTLTFPLVENSVAINNGIGSVCPEIDQRGVARINTVDDACDIGALETSPSEVVPAPVDDTLFLIPLPNGKSIIFNL